MLVDEVVGQEAVCEMKGDSVGRPGVRTLFDLFIYVSIYLCIYLVAPL